MNLYLYIYFFFLAQKFVCSKDMFIGRKLNFIYNKKLCSLNNEIVTILPPCDRGHTNK